MLALADMTWLSQNAAFFQPAEFGPEDSTIVLCTWMGALSRHIDFYLDCYSKLCPRARVILICGKVKNMYYVSRARFVKSLGPVLSALHCAPNSPVYVHLFSNAGAYSAANLLLQDQGTTKIQALILDSSPSYADYATLMAGWRFVIASWPWVVRLYAWLFGNLLAIYVLFVRRINPSVDCLSSTYQTLLDLPVDIPRIYLYSHEDQLVESAHILQHAAGARRLGSSIRLEKFDGTSHCRHGKEAADRYWTIVQSVLRQPS